MEEGEPRYGDTPSPALAQGSSRFPRRRVFERPRMGALARVVAKFEVGCEVWGAVLQSPTLYEALDAEFAVSPENIGCRR